MQFKSQAGVTLMELLVTVALLGIIAAIAIPSYMAQTQKSRRADAKITLVKAAQTLERCFTDKSSYEVAAGCPDYNGKTTEQGYYKIKAVQNATTFILTASPLAKQSGDTYCANFAIDQADSRTATNTDCW